ncbi:hypothetical protein T492DRAFT_843389 [Pavlovales sp. CCMP2436]|nr:hypothetical protein T492DRAFT_843389 [Pavlovales sp. CCMP2436]
MAALVFCATLLVPYGFTVPSAAVPHRAPARVSAVIMGPIRAIKRALGIQKQNFLEANPYYDQANIPLNTFKNKTPFTGKVLSVKRIVGPAATGETCDIVLKHGGKMPYWEGQSFGVIPPGINPKNDAWETASCFYFIGI